LRIPTNNDDSQTIDLPLSYLDLANTYLLKNHPHDSICGCSLDRVHDNMLYRYNQSEEISCEVIDVYKNNIRKTDNDAQDIIVDIYNPLPYADKRNVEVDVCFDTNYPCFYKEGMGYEKINSFKLYDCGGSVNITDKTTGRTYNGLLAPVSDSEIGDGWIHVNPVDSSATTSSTAYIEKIEDKCLANGNMSMRWYHLMQINPLPSCRFCRICYLQKLHVFRIKVH